MKGKCYYCNKELTERTIKRHMKNCNAMKTKIEELSNEDKKKRNQFMISIKSKYDKDEYNIYLSIDENLSLLHIDQFLRDVWLECCGHLSAFKIKGIIYQDYSMGTKLKDILNVADRFEYEYDFGSTTELILEVVDIIQVPVSFSQIEIIARNDEVIHHCEICNAEAEYFNYENNQWECKKCIDKNNDMIAKFDYCNSPRDGVCCYGGNKRDEITYLPGNQKKYKSSRNKVKSTEPEDVLFYEDEIFDQLSDVDYAFDDLISKSQRIVKNNFNKTVYSFDILELINNLSKDNIYEIAKYLGMPKISSLNKAQLAERLINEYEILVEEKMSLFDEERYKLLKTCADNNGVRILSQIDEKTAYKLAYFLQSGMIFSTVKDEEVIMIMPEIIQKLVKEKNNIQYRGMIKANTEIINLYRGMNKAYGILKLKDIMKIFKTYDLNEYSRIEKLLTSAQDYYREYEIQGMFYINCFIDNWVDLLREIEQKTNINYAMISKEELLNMASENYIYEADFGDTFFKEFLNMFNMDIEILEGLMESLYLEIQENDFEDVMNEILEQLEDDSKDVKDFMLNSVGKFIKNIRLWKLKGANINESSIVVQDDTNPPRRNDLCPCGSGRKYKDCCAKDGNVIKLF
ncbi:SEC-C metal-binding domain-containing protein [Clostridium sp. C2-6-12]|uniref:SEC-C metal-binding domain-containing protein n=1 Tax=Clostridium sp. C2-6-12 TaxID=2698832 RepID=UPI0013715242|nr:SEC-C metal-binding domain-containing protein [Clostridium sp. C2-6-12]